MAMVSMLADTLRPSVELEHRSASSHYRCGCPDHRFTEEITQLLDEKTCQFYFITCLFDFIACPFDLYTH
jgi:uncharacterized membrane-anchored protein